MSVKTLIIDKYSFAFPLSIFAFFFALFCALFFFFFFFFFALSFVQAKMDISFFLSLLI